MSHANSANPTTGPLSGQIALVTGAANRIGATIAQTLSSSGCTVIVHYNGSESGAIETVKTITASGGRAAPLQCDLSNRQQRDQLIAKATDMFGPLSILINNASIFEPDSTTTLDYPLWDAHMALHAEAPMFLARDFANQRPSGLNANIINMIDERVLRTSPAYFSYNLSKSLLWTATKTLAQNLAPHIRVNAIGPGPTLPNSRQTDKQFQQSRDRLPLGLSGDPDDIADAILFLLQAKSVTGQMIAVDGGEHLDWRHQSTLTPRQG